MCVGEGTGVFSLKGDGDRKRIRRRETGKSRRDGEIIAERRGMSGKLRATEKERKIERRGRKGESRKGGTEREREMRRRDDMEEATQGANSGGGGSRRSNIQRNVPGG